MDGGGRARVGHFVSILLAIGSDGGADLDHGGCEVVRGVNEGGAGVADGDAYKFDTSLVSSWALSKKRYLSVFASYFS